MEIFWALFLSAVFILILAAWIQSARQKRKTKKLTERYLKEVDDYIRTGERYTVVLSDGRRFEKAKIIGYSQFSDSVMAGSYMPTGYWLVLELIDERRIYLRPGSIRYFEQPKKTPNKAPEPTR
jgi:hypothetical protein